MEIDIILWPFYDGPTKPIKPTTLRISICDYCHKKFSIDPVNNERGNHTCGSNTAIYGRRGWRLLGEYDG